MSRSPKKASQITLRVYDEANLLSVSTFSRFLEDSNIRLLGRRMLGVYCIWELYVLSIVRESFRLSRAYLCTLPEPSPFMRFSTSDTDTLLKSPLIECLRQLAATANSKALASDAYVLRP